MRGKDTQNQTFFSYVRTHDRIPSNHPLRLIRQFDTVYAAVGLAVHPWGRVVEGAEPGASTQHTRRYVRQPKGHISILHRPHSRVEPTHPSTNSLRA
jgi:hypothetical protein